ncbi:DUF1684 domain-containing protein [Microbacterium aquimaris]|uniref:DUF1684 domain-containing protein n=1 Tax=Microbacterium aquimaris TaxID=459816 RepID=A0ABU5N3H1_9MICO|nr:DUF1684 domain-containing protein [Microbacterium aquimaris]MDZ8160643.1 DUF1684 domain-containing protein [Microbacterium aquimaris]
MTESPHALWREQRARAVTGPTGNLALVETRWTGAQRPDIDAERAAAAPSVTITELSRTSIETGEPEYGLRRWDAGSAAIRAFERIDTFAYDPEWVLEGRFTPVDGDGEGSARTVPFEHIRDNGGTRDLVVPGDIHITIGGEEFTVAAFDDGGTLLLVFGDRTNGSETYAPGRFLFVPRDAAMGGEPGPVVLDFNRAFVPPCGFSAQFNCPLPPASNRFPFRIPAGEKNVVFRDGFDIYAA